MVEYLPFFARDHRFGVLEEFLFLLKNGVVRFIFVSKKVKQHSFSFK